MNEKTEMAEVNAVDAEVVDEAKIEQAKIMPSNITENAYEGLERDLKAYHEERRVAWINSCKNKAAHVAKVFAKRKAAAKAAKKARKIQRKRK